MRRSILASCCVVSLAACTNRVATQAPPSSSIRLTPATTQANQALDVSALLDRDTSTSLALAAPVSLAVSFPHDVQLRAVKVYGARGVSVSIQEAGTHLFDGGAAWETSALAPVEPRAQWTVTLTPRDPGARIAELELWGAGKGSAPRDAQALALASAGGASLPYDNVFVVRGSSGDAVLQPSGTPAAGAPGAGTPAAPPCATFSLPTSLPRSSVSRAFLAYEAGGVQRPFALRRSLNGAAAVGGLWLGGGDLVRSVVDELDPLRLTGQDLVQLCLPDEAAQSVYLADTRLILVMDDGTNLLDRDAQVRAAEAFDGRLETAAVVPPVLLAFDRPTSLDFAALHLETGPARATLRAAETAAAVTLDVDQGWNSVSLPGGALSGLSLALAPAGGAAAPKVSEIALSGSPVGPATRTARIIVTSPALRFDGTRFVGERFGEKAFVAGWAESPAGPGEVTIAAAPIGLGNGSFASPLARPSADAGTSASWKVTLTARFPDGSTAARDLYLDDDHADQLEAKDANAPVASDDARFGRVEETSSGAIDAANGGRVGLGTDVAFEAPAGAVTASTAIGITRKHPEAVPPLDAGMINVTAPRGAGYRFTPEGQKFRATVAVTLPYDASLLPDGMGPADIQTFFYEDQTESWKPLPVRQLDRRGGRLVSETTHFTFMINAVLVAPDHPGPTSFNPTSIKDLKAADPSAGIDFIAPPEANSQGTAHVAFPLRLPPGRGAYKPALALAYDSQGGNGWTGVGWDLTTSSISVDTKFGVPYYDGTERYLLDGQQLVPIGQAPCLDGATGTRFAARAEGAFELILRCGPDSSTYHFEVADKSGVLYAYGVSPEARVASPRTGDIGAWHLERVIDPNGNLTRFLYEQDQKQDPGTLFDQKSGEDFRQSYLTEIHYTGKSARLGPAALQASQDREGAYVVLLQRQQDGQGGYADRPDIVTSARTGFKVVTRHRLDRVQVWLVDGPLAQRGQIREYALQYEAGDFGKTRLSSVDVFGRQKASFYRHAFSYTNVAVKGFGDPVAWTFDSADSAAISTSHEKMTSGHFYAGVSQGPSRSDGSLGGSVATGHRESTTRSLLLDLNGDGLPDRLTQSESGQVQVELNQRRDLPGGGVSHALSSLAPAGDPFSGGVLAPFAASFPLGAEHGDNANFAFQAVFGGFSASFGGSFNESRSDHFFMDVDGDGLPDYVQQGTALFNYPRTCTGPGCCPAGTFCFGNTKPVGGQINLAASAAAGTLPPDPALEAARKAIADHTPPTDAMIEWTAPYAGMVDVSGAMDWRNQPVSGAGHDGVRLRVYAAHEDGTMQNGGLPLVELSKLPADAAATPLSLSGVTVSARDRLYFVLSTLADFPVSIDPVTKVALPLEQVKFSPSIQYSCAGNCGGPGQIDTALVEATGAKAYRFDKAADFRLAGGPLTAVYAAYAGTVHIDGTVQKQLATSDDVRVCVQRSKPGASLDVACGSSPADVGFLSFASTAAGASSSFPLDVQVDAGDMLVFRVDSDLPIDPGGILWTPSGAMTSICPQKGSCRAPTAAEAKSLSFTADPFIKVHSSALDAPIAPYVVPAAGTLLVESATSGFTGPAVFAVRSTGALFLKHHENEGATVSLQVAAGDRLYFEGHAESDPGPGVWAVTLTLNSGTPTLVAGVLSVEPSLTSPFGGGFHGFRFGSWHGPGATAFDATIFYSQDSVDFGGGSEQDQILNGRKQSLDPNSPYSRRQLFSPLIPRQQGTRVNASVGLAPAPAFVTQDGTCFVTAQDFHAGKQGGFAATGDGSVSAQGLFADGDLSRASGGSTLSAGLSVPFGSLSVNVSSGSSTQRSDVRDMNGDGIIDVALAGSGVRLTDSGTLSPHAVPARLTNQAPFDLQHSSDLSVQVGLGYTQAFRIGNAKGDVKGQTAMFPSVGGGVGMNLSAVDKELVDINGDGLPDQVRSEGGKLFVRLNLGTSFAENEDELPNASWGSAAAFNTSKLTSSIGAAPSTSPEQAAGQQAALGALGQLGTSDVVRRNQAVTVEGGLSFTYEEEFGVTANMESSINSTSVMLIDVTGDGLPDYVRRVPGESFFTVKVNTGFGFGPPQLWAAKDWPAGVSQPALQFPNDGLSSMLTSLGVGVTADGIEATAIHSVVPSFGFAATVPIPIPPFAPVFWIILSGGADVSPDKVSGYELALMDIDGDGLPDHVLKVQGGNGAQDAVYARLNQNGGGNLLSRVSEPLGGSFELSYVRQGNTVAMPESRYVMTGVVVHDGLETGAGHDLASSITYAEGNHDRSEREFYGFATVTTQRPDGSTLIHRYLNDTYRRKGLLASEELRDPAARLFAATINTWDAQPALVARATSACTGSVPFFLSGDDVCSAGWVRLLRSERRFYEGQTADVSQPRITTAQAFTYDTATGNVTAFEDLGDLADTADDLSARVDYLPDGAATSLHAIDRPTHVAIRAGTLSNPGALLRERWGQFDAEGNLKEESTALGGGAVSVSTLEWTDDGELLRFTGAPNARGQRYSVSYTYGDATRQNVTSVTDSFGYTSSGDYDLGLGEPLRTTDVNGNSTHRVYDAFGRLRLLFAPSDPPGTSTPTVSVQYSSGGSLPAWALTANKLPAPRRDGSPTLNNVVFMDGLRRVVQTRADAEVRGVLGSTFSGRVDYDSMGRVVSQGQVGFSTSGGYVAAPPRNPTTFVHDVLGRNVLVTQPDASTTATAYGFGQAAGDPLLRFRTAVTDANGHLHVSFLDGAQRVSAVEERIEGRVPTTRYLYDPVAQLQTVIDAAGNRTEVRYDLGGRTVSLASPDSGLTEYSYDAAGNLTAKVDPNLRAAGQALRYQYDFNRVTRVQRPLSGDVLFEYGGPGAAENAASRITRIVDEAGEESRGYGLLGEVVRTRRTVVPLRPGDDPRSYETLFAFDSFGRMLRMVYPDGEMLQYGYDGGGLVTSAVGTRPAQQHSPAAREVYLQALQYDEFGQRVRLVLGNGVVSRYAYDARTRRLSGLSTLTPLQRTLQANSYSYDRVGNVLGIDNGLPPPAQHRSGPVSLSYQYDALDRLVSAQGVAQARPGVVDRFTSSFAYNDIHNMLRNTQVRQVVEGSGQGEFPPHSNHDFDYQYTGAEPHQAKRIGDLKLTYDANGNTSIQCRAGQGICAGTASPNGNVPASHDHWRRYEWTEENWLRQVTDGGGEHSTRFLYDSAGQRVVKFGRGTPSVTIGQFFSVQGGHHATKHVFAGTERIASKLIPVAEQVALWGEASAPGDALPDASGCTASAGADPSAGAGTTAAATPKCHPQPVALQHGPHTTPLREETYYYHPDHLGSTSWMTDHAGRVHEHVEYFPYGEVWRDSHLDEDPGPQPRTPAYLFTAKEYDPETKLYYFGARYYDPKLARWPSTDAALLKYVLGKQGAGVADPAHLSLYTYVKNNPLVYVDPDGNEEIVSGWGKLGPGDWRMGDRVGNTAVWKAANAYNLQHGGAKEYTSIEQRADFYAWFQGVTDQKGFQTKWAGAASEVAKGVGLLADLASGTFDGKVENFANAGNKQIFEDMFPRLHSLLSGPPLTGDNAAKWDAKNLSHEQNLIQPLYEEAKKGGYLQTLEHAAKRDTWILSTFGKKMTTLPPFKGNLMNVNDRWEYGMMNMGYDKVKPSDMPPP